MNRDQIIETLKRNRETLHRFGVKRLGLFGSHARNESSGTSDLDFLVEFESKSFDRYMELKSFLEDLFGCHVDLVLRNTIKPRLQAAILKETVYAPGL